MPICKPYPEFQEITERDVAKLPRVETATKFRRVSDSEIQVVAGGRPMSLSCSIRSGINKPKCFGPLVGRAAGC